MKGKDFNNLIDDFNNFLKKRPIYFGVDDKKEKRPQSKEKGFKKFAGGVARKTSQKESGITIGGLAQIYEGKEGIFSKPLQNKKNEEVISVVNDMISWFWNDENNKNRIRNGAQAIIRNPILRGDYGHNTSSAIKNKGFDRKLIDTGQLFNSIIAQVGEKD